MTAPTPPRERPDGRWTRRLTELCDAVREGARSSLAAEGAASARPVGRGAGDVTYAIDEVSERVVDDWLERTSRETPVSLLTEDRGWRHLGPRAGTGEPRELPGFDHGGPRIALDPIDGTRNLMADLRSAWTVVSFAGPGPAEPRLADLELGIVAEIPDTRAGVYRVLTARRGGPCRLEQRGIADGDLAWERALAGDSDDRPDHGYFPFFRYAPALRPALARVEAAFFERLAAHEGADVRHCFDDQYISNAGQLVLLALGKYRMIVDARARAGRAAGVPTTTSKPYDLAGAVLCAQAAGCVVTDADGDALDFPLDCETPVGFVGWANAPTARRLGPHLAAALGELERGG